MGNDVNLSISSLKHPSYTIDSAQWEKYRYIMDGGDNFINKYLVKYSSRESNTSFTDRKTMTPIPAFTRTAIVDVKNAIYQRMSEIKRSGGTDSYADAVAGKGLGIDLEGSTMNHFIGRYVLPELLFMGKVGVYVDMPTIDEQTTLADNKNKRPYVYYYAVESIKNWEFSYNSEGKEYTKLLLEERHVVIDDIFGLPSKEEVRYRYLYKENGRVFCRFYNENNQRIDKDGFITTEDYELSIPKIPFVLFEIDQPLTKDIANHQIALMNLESSDVSYSLKAGFPFYTEQDDGRQNSTHLKTTTEDRSDDNNEVEVGGSQGRRYGKGLDRPGFIHPSSEPLNASMLKQKNLKDDIRMLVNLALSNVNSKYASAESKDMDNRGLESGLSSIGLTLEHGERQIAQFFAYYENTNKVATIHYPERYSLKSDKDRLDEVDLLKQQRAAVPSKTYQKTVAKEIARILLNAKVSKDELDKIIDEIDKADYLTSEADELHGDIERGLVSLETASKARGYKKGEVPKAAADHAARLLRIKISQSDNNAGARGIDDEDVDPGNSGKMEKEISQNPDLSETGSKQVRGDEK